MHIQHLDKYEALRIAGKTGELLRIIKKLGRPNVSRNTIRMAFVHGATTPLRTKILEVADQILEEETHDVIESDGVKW